MADKFLLKFRTASNWENNIYIDNINMAEGAVSIDESIDQNAFLVVYPNPAIDWITILFKSGLQQILNLEIRNILGEVVYFDQVRGTSSTNQTSISVSGLAEGYYTLTLMGGTSITTKTFIKQ